MTGPAMLRADLEALARRWMPYWQGGAFNDFREVHAINFVDHSAAGRSPDRAGLLSAIEQLYRAYPDFHATVEFIAIDEVGGMATIRWSATGRPSAGCLDQARTTAACGLRESRLFAAAPDKSSIDGASGTADRCLGAANDRRRRPAELASAGRHADRAV